MYSLQHKHKQRRSDQLCIHCNTNTSNAGLRQHLARGNIWQHGNTARHKKMYLLRLSLKPTQTPPTRHTATLHNRSAREAQREQRSVTRRCIYCDWHLNPPNPRPPDQLCIHCNTNTSNAGLRQHLARGNIWQHGNTAHNWHSRCTSCCGVYALWLW